MAIQIRDDESITAFTIRRIRAEALEEARDRIMSQQPDTSALAKEHRVGFVAGHSTMRYAARDVLLEMIEE